LEIQNTALRYAIPVFSVSPGSGEPLLR